MKKNRSWDSIATKFSDYSSDYEKEFAKAIFIIEKETSLIITEDFPIMKLFSTIDGLKEHFTEKKKAYDKVNKK